jgi:hypothetical protein
MSCASDARQRRACLDNMAQSDLTVHLHSLGIRSMTNGFLWLGWNLCSALNQYHVNRLQQHRPSECRVDCDAVKWDGRQRSDSSHTPQGLANFGDLSKSFVRVQSISERHCKYSCRSTFFSPLLRQSCAILSSQPNSSAIQLPTAANHRLNG